jgi:Ca2+/Na+ antiporter
LDRIFSQEMMLLAVAALMLYAASRAGSEALGQRGGALGRAIGHSLPIGLVGIAAVWARLDALAVGVMFSASVMCLTLVIGVALLSAPLDDPIEGRHAWGLVLPVSIVCLIAGLMGGVSLQVALVLIALGGVIIWSWRGEMLPPLAHRTGASPEHPSPAGRVTMTVLAIVVGALAAVAVAWAVTSIAQTSRVLSIGTLAGTVIAPLTVLPLVGASSERAYRERSAASSIAAAVATAVLNLTVWLPLLAVLQIWRDYASGTVLTASLPIPLGVWRVDSVLLTAVGLMLVPIALRRWQPGKSEAGVLVTSYVVFVALMAMSGWR